MGNLDLKLEAAVQFLVKVTVYFGVYMVICIHIHKQACMYVWYNVLW